MQRELGVSQSMNHQDATLHPLQGREGMPLSADELAEVQPSQLLVDTKNPLL
jgi:hypothetical protein